jgi:hypothetical protein
MRRVAALQTSLGAFITALTGAVAHIYMTIHLHIALRTRHDAHYEWYKREFSSGNMHSFAPISSLV